MSFSTRSIISRFIAFGHVGHGFGNRNKRVRKSAEELSRELAEYNAAIAFHKETRRMIEGNRRGILVRR